MCDTRCITPEGVAVNSFSGRPGFVSFPSIPLTAPCNNVVTWMGCEAGEGRREDVLKGCRVTAVFVIHRAVIVGVIGLSVAASLLFRRRAGAEGTGE